MVKRPITRQRSGPLVEPGRVGVTASLAGSPGTCTALEAHSTVTWARVGIQSTGSAMDGESHFVLISTRYGSWTLATFGGSAVSASSPGTSARTSAGFCVVASVGSGAAAGGPGGTMA